MRTRYLLPIPVLFFVLAILGLAALCFMDSGCARSDEPTRVVPSAPDRSTPQAVLASLREAYVNRQIDAFESLLATDCEFYSSEEDQSIAERNSWPDEVTIHRNMFECEGVESIALTFELGEPWEEQYCPDPLHPSEFLWGMFVTNVDLEVRLRDNESHTVTYRLEDGVAIFWLRQDDQPNPGTGDPIWQIVQWRELTDVEPPDKGGVHKAVGAIPASWGQIKALFREECP
jgi:hypothetical protein